MIDPAAINLVEMAASAAGSAMTAVAHGTGDTAPLPTVERLLRGESLRPPSPCHMNAWRQGSDVLVQWTRRSHRGWTWADHVGVADDPFPERYRLTVTGTGGQVMIERLVTHASFSLGELPGQPGEAINFSVAMVGPMALSHQVSTTIIL